MRLWQTNMPNAREGAWFEEKPLFLSKGQKHGKDGLVQIILNQLLRGLNFSGIIVGFALQKA